MIRFGHFSQYFFCVSQPTRKNIHKIVKVDFEPCIYNEIKEMAPKAPNILAAKNSHRKNLWDFFFFKKVRKILVGNPSDKILSTEINLGRNYPLWYTLLRNLNTNF